MTVANKLTPLGRANLFQGKEKNSWQGIYSDQESKVNIMQLAGLSRDLAKIATEFILWDLYDYASHQGNKEQPLPMVLDEIQNLDHRLDSPLGKFLTEGRKFGLSAILATQTLSNLSQEAQSRLFMASHKLFFRPADTELKEYATLLANATSEKMDIWKNKLVALNKGECYSLGPSLNPKTGKLEEKAFPIRITALSERLVRRND
jgi:DNA phosphorothioation-dependent restriction protein DptH